MSVCLYIYIYVSISICIYRLVSLANSQQGIPVNSHTAKAGGGNWMVRIKASHIDSQRSTIKWIGLRENLQETIDFPIKYGAFL